MKIKGALLGFVLVTVLYVGALVWADAGQQRVPSALVWQALPVLLGLSLSSYAVRFARWHWLLVRAGHRTPPGPGFLAYLSGFAFTATPGKVGELFRMRYLVPRGVPAWRVLAAFVCERLFDLVAVLMLAALAIRRQDIFAVALAFVLLFLGLVLGLAWRPGVLSRLAARARRAGLRRIARLLRTLRNGLRGCRTWATPLDALVCLGSGLVAWSLTAASFVWLLSHLGVALPLGTAFSVYPLAMLAGAASMLPGGVGSTEATLVALLSWSAVPLATATLAAIGIRLATLWFAIVCGFVALGLLEWRR
jgi:uncharacterized protein (TIRG00374 family)